jgi:hypothetical protein
MWAVNGYCIFACHTYKKYTERHEGFIVVPKRRGVMAKDLRSAQQVSSLSQNVHLL